MVIIFYVNLKTKGQLFIIGEDTEMCPFLGYKFVSFLMVYPLWRAKESYFYGF